MVPLAGRRAVSHTTEIEMALSKKHYEQFAHRFSMAVAVVKKTGLPGQDFYDLQLLTLKELANDMATDFAYDNPRFDRQRFLTACGF